MQFGGVNAPNEAYVKLYVKSAVRKASTVLDYPFMSGMLAEVGGYAGLFLGISVVNVTSLGRWAVRKFGGPAA